MASEPPASTATPTSPTTAATGSQPASGSGIAPSGAGLFRQQAVESLDVQSTLEPLLRVTSARLWLALGACLAAIAAAVVWSVTGTAPSTVGASGILLPSSGIVPVTALSAGSIGRGVPTVGERFQAGQPVLTLMTADGVSMPINAPVTGTVEQVFVTEGSYVNAATPVAEMLPADDPIEGIMFVPASQGKQVRVGMEATVAPSTAPPAQYGSIEGVVGHVSSLPLSVQRIELLVGAESGLASSIASLGPTLEVLVDLKRNPSTPSGFAWTSGSGPNFKITPGTLLAGTITLSTQSPASVAFSSS